MTGTGAVAKDAEQWWIRAAGDRAWLLYPGSAITAARVAARLRERPIEGVQDVLPAAETVLVTVLSPAHAEPVRRELAALLTPGGAVSREAVGVASLSDSETAPEPVEIPVRYDGADLAHVAELLGTTVPAVIEAHTGTVWRCGFVGFAPGFGYLEAPDGRLTVPRRDRARTAIPAGAVALAGGYSAVYPRSTPGGWQLIGHSDAVLWDVDRDPPALIRAGSAVRFVAVGR
ncbi:allophanate hydrolase subunit 1 [Nocardia farcinica]|uniref:allophanate hydrolase subunit 1 n=1 Tax=Nocardia farcinica TaxID=37329 RepID=UPI003788DB71